MALIQAELLTFGPADYAKHEDALDCFKPNPKWEPRINAPRYAKHEEPFAAGTSVVLDRNAHLVLEAEAC